jgi:hypothetical protein
MLSALLGVGGGYAGERERQGDKQRRRSLEDEQREQQKREMVRLLLEKGLTPGNAPSRFAQAGGLGYEPQGGVAMPSGRRALLDELRRVIETPRGSYGQQEGPPEPLPAAPPVAGPTGTADDLVAAISGGAFATPSSRAPAPAPAHYATRREAIGASRQQLEESLKGLDPHYAEALRRQRRDQEAEARGEREAAYKHGVGEERRAAQLAMDPLSEDVERQRAGMMSRSPGRPGNTYFGGGWREKKADTNEAVERYNLALDAGDVAGASRYYRLLVEGTTDEEAAGFVRAEVVSRQTKAAEEMRQAKEKLTGRESARLTSLHNEHDAIEKLWSVQTKEAWDAKGEAEAGRTYRTMLKLQREIRDLTNKETRAAAGADVKIKHVNHWKTIVEKAYLPYQKGAKLQGGDEERAHTAAIKGQVVASMRNRRFSPDLIDAIETDLLGVDTLDLLIKKLEEWATDMIGDAVETDVPGLGLPQQPTDPGVRLLFPGIPGR